MIRTKPINGRSAKLTAPSRAYQVYAQLMRSSWPGLPSDRPYNISVSHAHRFVWYRVAKVCTRSIFAAIDSGGAVLDADHPMNCFYPPRYFKDYFKFAFVRSPWSRVFSCWCDKVIANNYFQFDADERRRMRDFATFVRWVAALDIATCDQHLRLQCRLIDLNHVDYLGRFENFGQDFSVVANRIRLKLGSMPHLNASENRPPMQDVYDGDTIELVASTYLQDISVFGYSYDRSA